MAKKHGPWTIIETAQKYRNPWIDVREDKVIRPDGKPGIFGTVTMKSGVSVLAIDDDGFAYLTDEFHYAAGKTGIEVVSGGIDAGETALEAARRELEEELGICAEEWTSLGRVEPFTNVIDSPADLFLARKLRFTTPDQEGTETIRQLRIPFAKAVERVMESKITHGQSCVLILKAHEYLRKNK